MPKIWNFKWGAGPTPGEAERANQQAQEAEQAGRCHTCNRSNVNSRVGGQNRDCPVDGTDMDAHDRARR